MNATGFVERTFGEAMMTRATKQAMARLHYEKRAIVNIGALINIYRQTDTAILQSPRTLVVLVFAQACHLIRVAVLFCEYRLYTFASAIQCLLTAVISSCPAIPRSSTLLALYSA